jgi:hypothetical protein
MYVSPDDPCLIVHAGGTLQRTLSPVAELFEDGSTSIVRTRPPGCGYDLLRAAAPRGSWTAGVRSDTRFTVDGDSLTTAGFTHVFGGTIFALAELLDGAWVVAWHVAGQKQYITALERDGRERWAVDGVRDMYSIAPLAHPSISDALLAYGSTSGALIHPWDGRIVCSWPEK